MTSNLAECMNFVLKGARSLPIYAFVKETKNGLWNKGKILNACYELATDILRIFMLY